MIQSFNCCFGWIRISISRSELSVDIERGIKQLRSHADVSAVFVLLNPDL